MNCVKPITLKDGRSVPCGRCFACLANRQRDWTYRLEMEKDTSSFFLWLTLTYDDEHLPLFSDGRPMVCKDDCRQFFERLRKRFSGFKFKHFLVSEYGPETIRPHYHLLLFVYVDSTNAAFIRGCRKDILDYLDSAWGKGFAYNKNFHRNVFGYVTKYCCKPDLIGISVPVPVFTLISQGIGATGLSKFDRASLEERDFIVGSLDRPRLLPRYLRNKVEREKQLRILQDEGAESLWRYQSERASTINSKSFERYCKLANMAAERDALHGAGSFSKKQVAIIESKQTKFINKLKQRQNV